MLNLRSILLGIVGSLALLAVLGFSRLFNTEVEVPEVTLREIELATIAPPPPPLEEEPPPELTPPPPPALTQISEVPDPTRVPVPKAEIPMALDTPVENFFADLAPAPLPTPPQPKPVRPPSRPTAPSHYQINQLDGIPKNLTYRRPVFPSALARRGVSKGLVVVEVEISTTGKASVRRIISSEYAELEPAARRVVESARFTPPKVNGKLVKAIMRWPLTIRK